MTREELEKVKEALTLSMNKTCKYCKKIWPSVQCIKKCHISHEVDNALALLSREAEVVSSKSETTTGNAAMNRRARNGRAGMSEAKRCGHTLAEANRVMRRVAKREGLKLTFLSADGGIGGYNYAASAGDYIFLAPFIKAKAGDIVSGREIVHGCDDPVECMLVAFFHEVGHCKLEGEVPSKEEGQSSNGTTRYQFEVWVSLLGIEYAHKQYGLDFSDRAVRWLLDVVGTYSKTGGAGTRAITQATPSSRLPDGASRHGRRRREMKGEMMGEVCGDDRFEVIEAAKGELLRCTNVESSPDEMAVLDSMLFRMWQMGWLPGSRPRRRNCDVGMAEEQEERKGEVINAIGEQPLYGHRSGRASKTHWMAFVKLAKEGSKV